MTEIQKSLSLKLHLNLLTDSQSWPQASVNVTLLDLKSSDAALDNYTLEKCESGETF